jgi:hypothetical protein
LSVINSVSLPGELPEEMRLANVCYSRGSVTVFYGDEQRDKTLVVVMLENSVQHAKVPGGVPVQLGDIVGYANDETGPDGVRNYSIFFEKRGWLYGVAARLGKTPGLPDNTVTPDDVKAVATSTANR